MSVEYVDYIRVEYIGLGDCVEDSGFAVVVGDIAVVLGDHGDVES